MLQTALHFSHQLLKEVVEPGDFVIDATMGNGPSQSVSGDC